MSRKKSSPQESNALTKEFLVEQLQYTKKDILETVDERFKTFERRVDAKIDYARKDSREQMQGIADGLNKKIDGLDQKFTQRIGALDKKIDVVHEEVKVTQNDVSEIKQKLNHIIEKVERHDKEIAILKSAMA